MSSNSSPLPSSGAAATAAAQALGLSALPPAVFNMREMRESLALAEQLARASMLTDQVRCKSSSSSNSQSAVTDNNNNSDKEVLGVSSSTSASGSYVPPKQLLLYLVRYIFISLSSC